MLRPKTQRSSIIISFNRVIFFSSLICSVNCSMYRCLYFTNNAQNYINNCPTRCNTKQSIYYSASSLYMLRVSATPIIRLAWPRWREVAAQKIWPVPEAVVTVLCGWHTKHAEWTCRIINRLLCVACRWTIINIQQQQQFRQLKQTLENGWI